MISPFGVEHGEVSKGVPKGLVKVAGKYKAITNDSKQLTYAHQRLLAHKQGRLAEYPSSYIREPARTKGHGARLRSRAAMV